MAGSTTSVEPQLRTNWLKSGRNRCRFYPDMATTALSKYAEPSGYYPPYTWIIPTTSGEIGSGPNIIGTGNITNANLAGGLNAGASLTGSGDITSAVGALVIGMVANLTGSGNLTTANLTALGNASANLSGSGDITTAIGQLLVLLNASANLTGSGSLVGDLGALAGMSANLTGSGGASGTCSALGSMSANILAYGSLTPEGIRDTVWNAVLANYPTVGTAGETLALAGSGGVDYAALANAVWTAVSRTLTSGSSDPAAISAAVVAALQSASPPIPTNVTEMNSAAVIGTGQPTDLWRGA